jgi:hypothetical protein
VGPCGTSQPCGTTVTFATCGVPVPGFAACPSGDTCVAGCCQAPSSPPPR